MYLSKLILNMRHPGIRQCLRNCQDMHRSLMSAFQEHEEGTTREQIKLLYFITQDATPIVWTSSLVKPNCEKLTQKGFSVIGIKEIGGLQQMLSHGNLLRFRLLAAPCKKVSTEGKHSKRRYLKSTDERSLWLSQKAKQSGFYVHQSVECGERKITGKKGSHSLTFTVMEWSGVLEVTDSATFWRAFCQGIGPGRAYGSGMLMISKV